MGTAKVMGWDDVNAVEGTTPEAVVGRCDLIKRYSVIHYYSREC